MKFQFIKFAHTVFFAGESGQGGNFYIILDGAVNVLLPKKYDQLQKDIEELKNQPNLQQQDQSKGMKRKFSIFDRLQRLKNKSENVQNEKYNQEENNQFDIENLINQVKDPIYQQLGEVPLKELDQPSKYFIDGVLKYSKLATLNTGMAFGELALIEKKPRAATILAKQDTSFAILSEYDYEQILLAFDKQKLDEKLHYFKQILFQEFNREQVKNMIYNVTKKKLAKGNFVFKQNQNIKALYIIKKGEVELLKKVSEKVINCQSEENPKQKLLMEIKTQEIQKNMKETKPGQFVSISILGPSQVLGDLEVFLNFPKHQYYALCYSNVVIYEIDLSRIETRSSQNPSFQARMETQCLKKQKLYNEKIDYYFNTINNFNSSLEQNERKVPTNISFLNLDPYDSVINESNKKLKKINIKNQQIKNDQNQLFQEFTNNQNNNNNDNQLSKRDIHQNFNDLKNNKNQNIPEQLAMIPAQNQIKQLQQKQIFQEIQDHYFSKKDMNDAVEKIIESQDFNLQSLKNPNFEYTPEEMLNLMREIQQIKHIIHTQQRKQLIKSTIQKQTFQKKINNNNNQRNDIKLQIIDDLLEEDMKNKQYFRQQLNICKPQQEQQNKLQQFQVSFDLQKKESQKNNEIENLYYPKLEKKRQVDNKLDHKTNSYSLKLSNTEETSRSYQENIKMFKNLKKNILIGNRIIINNKSKSIGGQTQIGQYTQSSSTDCFIEGLNSPATIKLFDKIQNQQSQISNIESNSLCSFQKKKEGSYKSSWYCAKRIATQSDLSVYSMQTIQDLENKDFKQNFSNQINNNFLTSRSQNTLTTFHNHNFCMKSEKNINTNIQNLQNTYCKSSESNQQQKKFE